MFKSTLVYFILMVSLLMIVPHVVGMHLMGSGRDGIPFTYREFSSAPPPAFGSEFTPWAFAADLGIYLGIAASIAWIRIRRKSQG